jgi:hypothetical protein
MVNKLAIKTAQRYEERIGKRCKGAVSPKAMNTADLNVISSELRGGRDVAHPSEDGL